MPTNSWRPNKTRGSISLSLLRNKNTFEMNCVHRGGVTGYMVGLRILRSFGERQGALWAAEIDGGFLTVSGRGLDPI